MMKPDDDRNNHSISNNLIIPQERIIRLPLVEWSKKILETFVSLKNKNSNSLQEYSQLATCFNLAALIEMFAGRINNATHLCHAQILWEARLWQATGSLEVLQYSLQPWINLGRIEYITGNYHYALRKFHCLFLGKKAKELNFGAIKIPEEKWTEIKRRYPELQSLIDNVFIIDSFKAMLKGQLYQEILDFSSIDNPILHEFIAEAKIVALWRTDKKDLALSFVETQIESCLKANQSVFILRKAQILAGLGEFNEAIKIGKKLALILQIVEMDKKPDINQVFYKKYVAEFLSLLGENKLAYATALTGFKDATILNDEPLRIEFLSILANCEDSKDWEKCLQELYKNTFYWHLMNRESLNSSILNHFNSLYQSLIIWAEHCIVE